MCVCRGQRLGFAFQEFLHPCLLSMPSVVTHNRVTRKICQYNKNCWVSTAWLAVSPFTTFPIIQNSSLESGTDHDHGGCQSHRGPLQLVEKNTLWCVGVCVCDLTWLPTSCESDNRLSEGGVKCLKRGGKRQQRKMFAASSKGSLITPGREVLDMLWTFGGKWQVQIQETSPHFLIVQKPIE